MTHSSDLISLNSMSVPSLGDPGLDEEHQAFLTLSQALVHQEIDSASTALNGLLEHARSHFDVEDAELRSMQDGNASCHIDEHAAVLKSLEEVLLVLKEDAIPEDSKRQILQRLSRHLLGWLPGHVREMDAGVATYRMKRRFGGAPVRINLKRTRTVNRPRSIEPQG